MRKTTLLSIAVIIYSYNYAQSLQVGDKVPDIVLENVIVPKLDGIVAKNLPLSNYKDKIVILDFWATWCGSCITSFPKYEALQKSFGDKLQIIMVTHQPVKRIQQFLKNRPMQLMVAVDTTEALRKYFEYRAIPHVILIDRNGIVRAITNSEEIKEKVIEDTWAGITISLPVKKDFMEFDGKTDYFNADSAKSEDFNLQPKMDGIPTFEKRGKGIFKNRRISFYNHTIDLLYMAAYKMSYSRTINEIEGKEFDHSNKGDRFCLDVIVPIGKEENLYTTIQKKLSEVFGIKAKIEKRKMSVYVLKKNSDSVSFRISKETNDFYSAGAEYFTGNGVKVSALTDYLENFGIMGIPVIDETGIKGRYDIQLKWEPEKKGAVREAFAKAGFILEKAEREIDVLVFYK
ncbi:MAG: TIGR03435 family protein [Chitinophagaceae bacterium]|nr:TIGR03435 family protein [Chitinophagaceae bacterium]